MRSKVLLPLRRSILAVLLLSLLVGALSGCARLQSIHRKDNSDHLQTIAVDAKQRFLISKPNPNNGSEFVICTEPSPDVFSALSAALEATGSSQSKAIEAAFRSTMSETAGTIGIRTQSIQLLRDAMYRLCEAYASGGIGPDDYAMLLSRYQKSMVTLIAIEQLTGAATPAQLVLTADASLTVGASLAEIEAELARAKKEKEKAKAAVDSNKAEIEQQTASLGNSPDEKCGDTIAEGDKDACEALNRAKEAKPALDQALAEWTDRAATWQKKFDSTDAQQSLSASGDSTSIPAKGVKMSEASVEALGDQVQEMVGQVFLVDVIDMCMSVYAKLAETTGNIVEITAGQASQLSRDIQRIERIRRAPVLEDEQRAAELLANAQKSVDSSSATLESLANATSRSLASAEKLTDSLVGLCESVVEGIAASEGE